MGKFADMAQAVSGWPAPAPGVPQHREYCCAVDGCPMAGALSDTTRGEGTWYCRVHYGRPQSEWLGLTAQAFELLRNPPPRVDSPAVGEMKFRGFPPR